MDIIDTIIFSLVFISIFVVFYMLVVCLFYYIKQKFAKNIVVKFVEIVEIYRGWKILKVPVDKSEVENCKPNCKLCNYPCYVAVSCSDRSPKYGVDLGDLKSDIDEAMR